MSLRLRWIGFITSVFFVLYLSSPFLGVRTYESKLARQEVLRSLDLNLLCGGTENCTPQEIAEQEREEVWIIQQFGDQGP
jgi:hypothetical protein